MVKKKKKVYNIPRWNVYLKYSCNKCGAQFEDDTKKGRCRKVGCRTNEVTCLEPERLQKLIDEEYNKELEKKLVEDDPFFEEKFEEKGERAKPKEKKNETRKMVTKKATPRENPIIQGEPTKFEDGAFDIEKLQQIDVDVKKKKKAITKKETVYLNADHLALASHLIQEGYAENMQDLIQQSLARFGKKDPSIENMEKKIRLAQLEKQLGQIEGNGGSVTMNNQGNAGFGSLDAMMETMMKWNFMKQMMGNDKKDDPMQQMIGEMLKKQLLGGGETQTVTLLKQQIAELRQEVKQKEMFEKFNNKDSTSKDMMQFFSMLQKTKADAEAETGKLAMQLEHEKEKKNQEQFQLMHQLLNERMADLKSQVEKEKPSRSIIDQLQEMKAMKEALSDMDGGENRKKETQREEMWNNIAKIAEKTIPEGVKLFTEFKKSNQIAKEREQLLADPIIREEFVKTQSASRQPSPSASPSPKAAQSNSQAIPNEFMFDDDDDDVIDYDQLVNVGESSQ